MSFAVFSPATSFAAASFSFICSFASSGISYLHKSRNVRLQAHYNLIAQIHVKYFHISVFNTRAHLTIIQPHRSQDNIRKGGIINTILGDNFPQAAFYAALVSAVAPAHQPSLV
jgi:hypothetical protein